MKYEAMKYDVEKNWLLNVSFLISFIHIILHMTKSFYDIKLREMFCFVEKCFFQKQPPEVFS